MNNIVKVDMIPKSFGVRTLSCSQGDTKREFKFTLNDVNGTIDTSDVEIALPQFPVYKGGTEEILPTNGSVPSTAPIIADIQYPQGLLNDQEFLYRESPTEEDGLAKITDIKGNTLVWNQLVQNGNFADKSNWIEANATFTVNNNVATMVASATYGNIEQILSVKANHMYFATCDIKLTTGTNFNLIQFRPYVGVSIPCVSTTEWQTLSGMFIPTTSASVYYPRITDSRASGWDAIQIRNCMVIDLTQMGLDITEPSEFTSLFPLSFYDFNQGTLIPFSGNGIKTVGFNQWDEEWELGSIDSNGQNTPSTTEIRSKNYIPVILGETYYIKQTNVQVFHFYDGNLKYLGNQYIGESRLLNIPSGTEYIRFRCANTYGTSYKNDICLNISDPSKNGTYEPYTSTTTSLPISTYFPTGMKSAGTVYDELAPAKAITRIGAVDLGTLAWTYASNYKIFICDTFTGAKGTAQQTQVPNMKCAIYRIGSWSEIATDETKDMALCHLASANQLRVRNLAYTDATAFKTAMNGVMLYYELATETETEITSASLVTENGEIQLSPQGDYLVGTVNSSVSRKSGMFDAKVKLANGDGTVYSNKLQLYVERSPK